MEKLTFQKIAEERNQAYPLRKKLYKDLEKRLRKPVVAFFTSFVYPVSIEDSDANMLEEVLQRLDLSSGLVVLINSPGGSALAAERIINIFRNYSGTKEYQVIVPDKAKSAATMICLGASKIIMSPTSELGPVDPQKVEQEEGKLPKWFSVYNIISSYERLFQEAIKLEEKQRIEPYIQQLSFYDPREIEELRSALELSEDITIKALKTGMFKNLSEEEIRKKIEIFLVPKEKAKIHGRPIFAEEAKKIGLNIEIIEPRDVFWKIVRELYVRLNDFVSRNNIAKCIENKNYSFHASIMVK
jgi:hypothetical protein